MTRLGLTYITVNVPARREERAELVALTDQAAVPVLEDGDSVLMGSDDIIEYLLATYPAPADADEHVASSAYRSTAVSTLTPRAALARLKELLEEHGLTVFAEIEGASISARLPAEYTLLEVGLPTAADPVGMVWLYGEPALNKLQRSVHERVDAVFAQF